MKEWTKEMKQRVLSEGDTEELRQLHEQISQSKWREKFHVQTVTGLMNDPNGFCYFDGKWHLFYQWFPFGSVHGTKHWYHVVSEDLVTWKNIGLGLAPDVLQDNKGCFSGTAFVRDEDVILSYTGNNRDYAYVRHPFQLYAIMDKDGKIEKGAAPLFSEQKGYTEHQRDPKLFEYEGKYYILIGAQRDEGTGVFLMFESDSPTEGWKLRGELKVRGYDTFGYMVECPDLARIGDKWMLMLSPQGLEPDGLNYRNKFNNVYFIGDMDFENMEFIPQGHYQELDRGFDFYAAQTACQDQYENTAVLEGWFGVSDYTYPPTDEEEWAGLMTMPRELTVENGKLLQKPSRNAEKLRGEKVFEAKNGSITVNTTRGLMPETAVIRLENPEKEFCQFNLWAANGKRGFEIKYDKYRKTLTIDRGDLKNQCNTEFGTDRTVVIPDGLTALEIYADRSSVEIFVNDGEFVLSSRVFPEADENLLRLNGRDVDLTIWKANTTVEDDFVL